MPQPTLARLVDRLSGATRRQPIPEEGPTRRGFLARVAVVGSALAVNPFDFVLKPGTAYASVCGSGASCGDGWSVFCCTINNGRNSCPEGSYLAGWWKADNSTFCAGAARYYLDCNAICPTRCTCFCPTGTCDNRRTCCNQFRYGQCNTQIACYGPVVCRVVTCTPPWQFDPACTTTSITNNATATHDAPCNPRGPDPVRNVVIGPAAGRNADGRLEVFLLDPDRSLDHAWQRAVNSPWTPIVSFKGRGMGTPAVATNADGRLEVFMVVEDGTVAHAWQLSPGSSWSPFVSFPERRFRVFQGVAATRNLDGRLEIFAVDASGTLVHRWQKAPNSDWDGWAPFPGTWAGSPAATSNADGRLEVFVVGQDGRLYHSWQTSPGGTWSGFSAFDGQWPAGNNPAAVLGPSGRLELFALGNDRRLYHQWQRAPGSSWSGWVQFGTTTFRASPAAVSNADGRLEVFVPGDDQRLYHRWQWTPDSGDWSGWAPLGGPTF